MSHNHTHAAVESSAGDKIESKFVLSLTLTGLILIAEIVGGLWTGSLALLSDAAHVFLDMFALGLSYGAIRLAALPANDQHTYGFHRMKVLAAFINGATLLLVAFEIFREAWARFQNPEPILAGPMLVVAVIGLGVNLVVAFVLREHDHDDLNTRAAFLHVLGDTLSSVGVIAAGVVILFTGWMWVDPLVSVLIGLIILAGSGRVLKQTIHILTEGAPEGVTASEVAQAMRQAPGVAEVHDLHVWTVSPGYPALSAHVVLADQALSQTGPLMAELKETIYHRFGIEHTTIQFECHNCGQGVVVCVNEAEEVGSLSQ
ncbi:MAG: cation transporter [Anaerolineae bacterium]|nr:cation transporter [Anaerolineales bacterium]MCQ3975522.1 cation transporter [Anaerolineae bacterium]